MFFLARVSLYILQLLFCFFLVYFLLLISSCQYLCKWLPGLTRFQNDLLIMCWVGR